MRIVRDIKSFDFVLLVLVTIISIFGIIIISSSSPESADKQKLFFLSGLVLLLLATFIDYNFICKFYIVYYLLNLALLITVLLIPNETNIGTETTRWIKITSNFNIQPSEFSKIFLIIFLSKYIDKQSDKINNIFILLSVFLFTFIPLMLIMIQPSLSASLVTLVIMLSILFIAGINYKYILGFFGVGIPLFSVFYYDIVYNKLYFLTVVLGNIFKSYHFSRIVTFVNKDKNDPLYKQTWQSLLAIGSGKLSGKGLYNGEVNNLSFVANNKNDFIISVIGEELGFIGCIAVVVLMLLILIKCFLIANRANSTLGRNLVVGVIGMFAFQAFLNICVATDLSINTGIAFPFVSYGGSSIWVNMICIGLVINVGMEKTKSIFEG